MANNQSSKIQIPLAAPLNLSANKVALSEYIGYNKNNGTISRNTLHNYYSQEEEGQYYKDSNNNEYRINGNTFTYGRDSVTFNTNANVQAVSLPIAAREYAAYNCKIVYDSNHEPTITKAAYMIERSNSLDCYVNDASVQTISLTDYPNMKVSCSISIYPRGDYTVWVFGILLTNRVDNTSTVLLYMYDEVLGWVSLGSKEISTYTETTCVTGMYTVGNYGILWCGASAYTNSFGAYRLVDFSTGAQYAGDVVTENTTQIVRGICGSIDKDGYFLFDPMRDLGQASSLGYAIVYGKIGAISNGVIYVQRSDYFTYTHKNRIGELTQLSDTGYLFLDAGITSFGLLNYKYLQDSSTGHYVDMFNLSLYDDKFIRIKPNASTLNLPAVFKALNESITVLGSFKDQTDNALRSKHVNWKYGYVSTVTQGYSILQGKDSFDPYYSDFYQGIFKSKSDGSLTYVGYIDDIDLNFRVEGQYLIFNNTAQTNMYDTLLRQWYTFAMDYDEHIIKDLVPYNTDGAAVEPDMVYSASYINGLYTLSNVPVSSSINNPSCGYCQDFTRSAYNGQYVQTKIVRAKDIEMVARNDYSHIEVYKGSALTAVSYIGEIYLSSGRISLVSNPTYEGTTAFVDTDNTSIYPAPLLQKYISSYAGHDMVNDLNTSYLLQYYNGIRYFIYKSSDVYENAKATFSIRGTQYQVVGNMIYQIGTVYQPIVSVAHMKYIGANTYTAYFLSDVDRYIYTFDGNITLQQFMTADGIDYIDDYIYNTGDSSILLYNDKNMTILDSDAVQHQINQGAKQVYLSDSTIFAFDGTNTYCYSESVEIGPKVPIELSTMYYKSTGAKIVNTDCYYIKLYSETPMAGTVKCSASFLADKLATTPTQTFNIKKSDWNDTSYISLRYQPKYNINDGVSLNITSDFPILSLEAGVSATSINGVTRINI